jgi:ubiquinone/menaquinone biosynthesis C-methylase UbiE
MIEDLLARSLTHLRCPNCQSDQAFTLYESSREIRCQHCQADYSYAAGYLDFMPMAPARRGLAQRFMENPLIVSIYENYFRPVFTSLGSPIKYDEEASWLARIPVSGQVQTVLDLAAGTGRYARLLAEQHQPKVVFAVDISEPMIRHGMALCAAQGYDNILYMRADAQQLPFRSAEIDRLNCFGALHLFPDPPQALAELARVAKPGAAFSCLTACEYERGWKNQAQEVFSRLATFRFFSEPELRLYLEKAGWRDMSALRREMLLMFSATAS